MTDTTESRSRVQLAIMIVGAAILLNGVFYALSGQYFSSREAMYGQVTLEHITGVRIAFAVLTGVLVAGLIPAVWYPLTVGLVLSTVASLFAIRIAFKALAIDAHPVLPATMLILACVIGSLVEGTRRGSRASWSFLCATMGVLAVMTFFGVTNVRRILDTNLWYAMIVPGLLGITAAAVAMARDRVEIIAATARAQSR